MPAPQGPIHSPPPLLFASGWLVGSLLLAVLVTVMASGAINLPQRLPAIALVGTFAPVATDPGPAPHLVLRFVDGDRALVRADGEWNEAFYRVEKSHVVLETVPGATRTRLWALRIDGERLVDRGVVLARK